MGNKEGRFVDPELLKDRLPRSTFVDLEENWRKHVGKKKDGANFEQFKALMPMKFNDKDLPALFHVYDHNKNGVLSWSEYICTVTLLMVGTFEEKVHLIFHAFDKNGDGHISKEELKEAVKKFARPEEDIDAFVGRVMREIDADSNGRIDATEFASFIRKYPEEYQKIAFRLNITLS